MEIERLNSNGMMNLENNSKTLLRILMVEAYAKNSHHR